VALLGGIFTAELEAADKSVDAQRRAIAQYPELGKQGSPLHKKFLELVDAERKSNPKFLLDPEWPLAIAKKASEELSAAAKVKSAVIAKLELKLTELTFPSNAPPDFVEFLKDENAKRILRTTLRAAVFAPNEGLVPRVIPTTPKPDIWRTLAEFVNARRENDSKKMLALLDASYRPAQTPDVSETKQEPEMPDAHAALVLQLSSCVAAFLRLGEGPAQLVLLNLRDGDYWVCGPDRLTGDEIEIVASIKDFLQEHPATALLPKH
jgi:hypothetical protein